MGVFEALENLDALATACQITALPFEQMNIFLQLCEALASNPVVLFHLAAYRSAKRHVFDRLAQTKATTGKSAFALHEGAFLRRRLFDHAALKGPVGGLYASFEERYGSGFAQGMTELWSPRETA